MINQQNKHKSRVGVFGASDTHFIMGNWESTTFMNWWQTKLGVKINDFRNVYTLAGTYKEHLLADWYEQKYGVRLLRDRRIKVFGSRLVINLDTETKDTVIEIKTFKNSEKEWKVPKNYWEQVQVQMFVTKKKGKILAYALNEEDYNNFYLPIDEDRIFEFDIEFDKEWVVKEYLPREKYLEWCIKRRKTPNIKEFREKQNV